MEFCVLKNECQNPDMCCHFCSNKKCAVRCLDDVAKCKYSISKPREWHQPWPVPKKEEKPKLPKTLIPFSDIISKYYKEKDRLKVGRAETIHHVKLTPGHKSKEGKSEIVGRSLYAVIVQLRKVK